MSELVLRFVLFVKALITDEGLLLLLLLLLVTGGVDPQEPTRLVQEAGNVLTHVC